MNTLCKAAVWMLFIATAADAHPFHASSAELEWNAESKCFEVAWKIDPNDLEQELRRRTKRKVVIDVLEPPYQPVFAYIREVFAVTQAEKKLEIKPVGFEVDAKDAWVYFEIPVQKPLGELVFTNKLLVDAPHQTNTLLLKAGDSKLSLTFNEDRLTQRVSWAQSNGTAKLTLVAAEKAGIQE